MHVLPIQDAFQRLSPPLSTGIPAGERSVAVLVVEKGLVAARPVWRDSAADCVYLARPMSLDTPGIGWQPGDDLTALVARHAREAPDRPALVHGPRSLTWGQLDRRVDRAASALLASGSLPGDKVALLGEN